ncbi:MAG: carboxypeptidase-like regulatory domain-containing protein [Caldiserica bacterium]|nr:carboxypeptidase-like regulatory domain-containing protein [Caldisericota bacterium]
MKRITVVLLVLSLLLVAGCGNPTPKTETGKVTIVVEDDSGTAVKGAAVTLTDGDGKVLSATSSVDGAAVFNAVAYGDYDVASSMNGYADGMDMITVDSSSQDLSLGMTSTAANPSGSGEDTSTIGDASVIDSLTSYRYKWTTLSEGDAAPTVIEGGMEKPNSEYYIMHDKDGKTQLEFYKVDGTVKMGTAGTWQTLTGDEAKNFGYGDTFVSTLTGDYSNIKDNSSDWKKSDGGSINGYDTDKYAYSVDVSGVTMTASGYFVRSGEFKGIMTRYDISYQNIKDATKRSGFTIDTYDLNRPLGIKLP